MKEQNPQTFIAEQITHLSGERKVVPVPHPLTLSFLKTAIESGAFSTIDDKKRTLISMYFLQWGIELRDITPVAHVEKPVQVWRIIASGMDELWESLSPDLQKLHPKEDVIKRKSTFYSADNQSKIRDFPRNRTHSAESRAAIGRTRVGKTRDAEVRKKIKEALLGRKRPEITNKRVRFARRIKRAEREGVLIELFKKGVLTKAEFKQLQEANKDKTKVKQIGEGLLDIFLYATDNLVRH